MNKILLIFLILSIKIYADVKWISLEADNKSKKKIKIIQLPQLKSITRLIENANVIKNLIDNSNTKAEKQLESRKNWYIIKNIQID